MPMTPHDRILVDNQRAHDFAGEYMQAVNGELYARGLILTSAMTKFAKFLDLPVIPGWYERYLQIASTALSWMCPELYLAKFLGEEEQAVKRALVVASALGNKKARVVETLQGLKDAGEQVKSTATKVQAAYDKAKQASDDIKDLSSGSDVPGAKDLAKLDASKGVIKALIASSRTAAGIWSGALQTLANEFEKQLSDLPHPPKESLEEVAKRLLKQPTALTDAELDQVELLFLYQMIQAYVKAGVVLTKRIQVWDEGSRDENDSVSNLNNNQKATILALFGLTAKRGKIFFYPPISDLTSQLEKWGVRVNRTVVRRQWTGSRF